MRALVAANGARGGVELRDVDEPRLLPSEALVRVTAFSVNRGETKAVQDAQDGALWGWDVAGVVERAAPDGSGPAEGARVVGMMNRGAWAEKANVAAELLAELPDGVSDAQAATLPVAGLTALKALDAIGSVIGRRVLVTGASGGVGRFGVQLAAIGGAHVTGVSASPERAAGLTEFGADEVIHHLSADGDEFDAVLEGVGGDSLAAALQRVTAGGTVVSYASTLPETTFPTRAFFARAPRAQLRGFYLFDEFAHTRSGTADFERLLGLVATGRLECSIDRTAPWTEAGEVLEALLDRTIAGKAVLTVEA